MEDDEQIPILKDTLELCRKFGGNLPAKSPSFSGRNQKSQSRNRWQKRGRYSGTRPKNGTGTVESASAAPGPSQTVA